MKAWWRLPLVAGRWLACLNRRTFHPRYLLNRARQVQEYLGGQSSVRSLPSFITLELTNHCNLRCILCPRHKMRRSQGTMDPALFTSLVDQVADYIEVVDLDLFGEFELHPRWRDLITFCRSRGLFTVLNTNATLLDDEVAEGLITSGLDFLNISLDAASPEVYERIRVGARFGDTLRNVRRFLQRNRSIFTTVQMVHTTENEGERAAFRRVWKQARVDRVRVKEYIPMDPARPDLDPRTGPVVARPCFYLWKSLVVSQDGLVVPCCVDYDQAEVVGDARRESLLDIWRGERMRRLREKHQEGRRSDITLCAPCRPLTYPASLLVLGVLADDATRRRMMPDLEQFL